MTKNIFKLMLVFATVAMLSCGRGKTLETLAEVPIAPNGPGNPGMPNPSPTPQLITIGEGDLVLESPNAFDFGDVLAGTQKIQAFSFRNAGVAPADQLVFSLLPGGYSYHPAALIPGILPCQSGGSVLPGERCSLGISFTATPPAGSVTASPLVTYYNGREIQTISLSLNATVVVSPTPRGVLTVSGPPANAFSAIPINPFPAAPVACLTYRNQGNAPITAMSFSSLSAPFATPSSLPASCTNPICGSALAENASCDKPISFNPTVLGNFSVTVVTVYFDAVGALSLSTPVTGTAVVPQPVAVSTSFNRLSDNGPVAPQCVYVYDASGVPHRIVCSSNGPSTLSPQAFGFLPNSCNSLRFVFARSTGASPSNILRDTALGGAEMNYMVFNRSVNGATATFTVTMNDNEDTTDPNSPGFKDIVFTFTLPSANFTVQNTTIPCP